MLSLSSAAGNRAASEPGDPKGRAKSFYKPELDVLRFFAFFSVFVFHIADYPTAFLVQHHFPPRLAVVWLSFVHAGMYGVDLFFLLSAYLITELLLREKESMGRLDIGAFYLRRILRIWPLYYLFIAMAFLVPALNPNHLFSVKYLLAFLFLMGNWSFIGYGIVNSVVIPLWSVSVEEQFYLLWPPLVARLSRCQIIAAAIVMIFLANSARIVTVLMHQILPQAWMNSFAHLDSIAAGILIATLWRGRTMKIGYSARALMLLAGAGCLAVVAHFVELDGQLLPGGWLIGSPMVPLACTAILLSFFDLPIHIAVLRYLGKISYGLYVFHFAGIWVVDRMLPGGGAGAAHAAIRFVAALLTTIAMAMVSYKFVETPFLNLKKRFTYVKSRPV
jgi:peptidoglycan/LPS O-acetylase OafA/YrhL